MGAAQIRQDQQQFVVFKLDGEEYGISILQVHGVEKMLPITPVPKAPDFVAGVTNLRGEVIPVISLRKRLGLRPEENLNNCHVIVVKTDDATVGLVVDEISQVLQMPVAAIEETPEIVGDIDTIFIRGIGKLNERLIVLLDIDEILDSELDV